MSDLLNDLYDYLENPIRYERYIHALCPFHDDSRPSFFVYEDRYYCAACGVKGKTENLLDDLRRKQGVLVTLKKQTYFQSPWRSWQRFGSLEKILQQAHNNLIKSNKTAYLKRRGITIETMKSLNLGWLDDWITFPIYDCDHRLIGATARAGETNKSSAKYCNVPDMPPDLLYVPDWKMVQLQDKLYLTFGILDAVTLFQLGFASASTTTGKRLDHTSLDDIRKKIVIIPDRGEEKEALLLASKLGWRGTVARVDWPDGCKDISDVYCKYGEEKLHEIMA